MIFFIIGAMAGGAMEEVWHTCSDNAKVVQQVIKEFKPTGVSEIDCIDYYSYEDVKNSLKITPYDFQIIFSCLNQSNHPCEDFLEQQYGIEPTFESEVVVTKRIGVLDNNTMIIDFYLWGELDG